MVRRTSKIALDVPEIFKALFSSLNIYELPCYTFPRPIARTSKRFSHRHKSAVIFTLNSSLPSFGCWQNASIFFVICLLNLHVSAWLTMTRSTLTEHPRGKFLQPSMWLRCRGPPVWVVRRIVCQGHTIRLATTCRNEEVQAACRLRPLWWPVLFVVLVVLSLPAISLQVF